MGRRTWLADIEVYPNYFLLGIKNYRTKETITFEVSPYKDEREALYEAYNNFDGYFVTFNGIHYDQVVLNGIIREWKKFSVLPVHEFTRQVKEISNMVIEDNHDRIKFYKWHKSKFISLDLFLYWSKLLRVSKKISLKSLAIHLGWDEIQELPYEHTKYLSKEEMDVVKRYNTRNDLGVLEKLFEEMKEEIRLRHYIEQEYGLECWSKDAPKICSEYLLDKFCNKTYKEEDGPFHLYKSSIRKSRYIPQPFKIGEYLPPVKFKTPFFEKLYEDFCDGDRTFYRRLPFNKYDTSIVLLPSVGGIHSENDDQVWKSDEDWVIVDADIASLYPTLLDEYKLIRPELTIVLEEYLQLKKDRITAKREGNKIKDKFLKLCLNGFTGIADQDVSWVYSPEYLVALRVLGQLIQLRFIEDLTLVDGIKVFFTNTDGTCCLVRKDRLDYYHQVAKAIEKEFRVTWEFTKNSKMVFVNTNAYLSIIEESYMLDDDANIIGHKVKRDIKRKGLFKLMYDEKGNREIPLGDSINELIIPNALNLYFTQNVPLEESISNPEKYGFHIYDYCKSNKVGKDYNVIYDGKKVQNLNRYYFARNKPYLFKAKKGKTTQEHMNVGEGVTIFNKYEEKPWEEYNINYAYYIAKARKIVNEVTKQERQLKLF